MWIRRLSVQCSARPLLSLAILLALVKSAQFAVDSTALFFNDSGAFLLNGLKVMFVPQRSYFYGYAIRIFSLPFHSLRAIVAMQVAMGGITAWLLGYALLRFFRVRTWIAVLAALAFAFDPVQIVLEHLIMAETTAMFVTAIFLIAASQYLETPDRWRLALLAFLGVLLAALRIMYLPVVIASAALLPLAAYFWSPAWPKLRGSRALAIALAVSCGFTLVCHQGYTHLTGRLAGREPAYHYQTGFFLVSAAAPIIKVQDSDDPHVTRAIVEQNHSELPLFPPDLRAGQLWDPNGLAARLRNAFGGDLIQSNRAAQRLAFAAIRRNPAGFLKLGLDCYVDYWRRLPKLEGILPYEDGSREPIVLPYDAAVIQSYFGVDVSRQDLLHTPSRRLHIEARYWYLFLLASPLLAAMALCLKPSASWQASLAAALFLVWSCLVLVATCLGAVESMYRYLHPLSFTGLAAAAFLVEKLCRRRPTKAVLIV